MNYLIKLFKILIITLIIALMCKACFAEVFTNSQIASAIYKAEGGSKTNHPYGILVKYKHTTPRQACLNTIKSAQKRFAKQSNEQDFIHFLSITYCPIGAANDPTGLNKNWEHNVKYFLDKRD